MYLSSGEPDMEVQAAFKRCDKDGNQLIDFVREPVLGLRRNVERQEVI